MENKTKEKSPELKREIKEKLVTYLTAAFGLVAGLAWNDAIKELINFIFPLESNSLIAKFIYAILITLFIIVISFYLIKLMKTKK